MFFRAEAFNQDISNWDTSIVQNMESMFMWAEAFNRLTIGGWIIRNDCNTNDMFQESGITRETFIDANDRFIGNRKIGEYFNIEEDQINYLTVEVKSLYGKTEIINVNPYDQISYVKEIIRSKFGMSNDDDFRVIFNSNQLDLERSLDSYNFQNENILHIVNFIRNFNNDGDN
jgi:surface protein